MERYSISAYPSSIKTSKNLCNVTGESSYLQFTMKPLPKLPDDISNLVLEHEMNYLLLDRFCTSDTEKEKQDNDYVRL